MKKYWLIILAIAVIALLFTFVFPQDAAETKVDNGNESTIDATETVTPGTETQQESTPEDVIGEIAVTVTEETLSMVETIEENLETVYPADEMTDEEDGMPIVADSADEYASGNFEYGENFTDVEDEL